MKGNKKAFSEAIKFQWVYYERFLNLYSVLLKLAELFEKKERIAKEIPEILVRGTDFDACFTVLFEDKGISQGFYSLLGEEPNLSVEKIEEINKGALSPSTFFDTLGYGVLYVHPLTFELKIKGFVVLGKKEMVEKEKLGLKEVELVIGIFNRFLQLFGQRQKEFDVTKYLPTALLLLDRKGTLVYANEKAKEMFSPYFEIKEGTKIESLFPDFKSFLLEEESFLGEVSFKAQGVEKVYEIETYPVKGEEGKTILKGMTIRDVSAIKVMEEEAFYREKMETLGMLSAGIAHDFNNLLTGILGYASMLKGFLSHDEKLQRYAEVIERSAIRASNLTKHLLNFSRRQRRPATEFDLHVILDDTLFLVGESFRDITVKKEYEARQFLIKGDESEFQHVFLNLFMNAKDAMEGSGTLSVETKKVSIQGIEFVRVKVEDTGKGMDDETLQRLFRPHFTTKKFGGHVGLGLYRVEKTIKKYGGFIEVESEKGKGTRFYLYIPISEGMPEVRLKSFQVPKNEEKKERKSVLVVDDEDFICEMFKHVLSEKFDVTCCLSGEDALRQIEERDFDLIVLDIIMPGMKGDEVLRKVRERGKALKVLISSGYMREDQRERIRKLGADAFLDKPFREEDILKVVSDLMDLK